MATLDLITSAELAARLAPLEAFIRANEEGVRQNREEIARVLSLIGSTPPPPDGITIGLEDNIQEAILDANGQQIWMKDGIYKPFEVVSNTRVQAINPGMAEVQGVSDWNGGWVSSGAAWYKDLAYTFHQHPAHAVHSGDGQPSQRGLAHRAAMQPHLLLFGGAMMHPVYSANDLVPGTFWLEGTSASPKGIWAIFPESASPTSGRVQLGTSQYLIRGKTADVDGVELDGLTLRYCANTGTFGALHMEPDMEYWRVTNCGIYDTMSEGARLRGSNHVFDTLKADRNGHVGIAAQGLFRSQLLGCEASHNVWRSGVDPLWHAGGLKWQYGCNENVILNLLASHNGGAGMWLDIYNTGNVIDGFLLENNKAFGLHIEPHTTDGVVQNGAIRGTRPVDLGSRIVQADLRLQRGITGYKIKDVQAGHIYYKKDGGTDLSGFNTFENVVYDTMKIDGSASVMSDNYINTKQP